MNSPKIIKSLSIVLILLITKSTYAQLPDGFDLKKACQDAQNKGISSTDIEGYVQYSTFAQAIIDIILFLFHFTFAIFSTV